MTQKRRAPEVPKVHPSVAAFNVRLAEAQEELDSQLRYRREVIRLLQESRKKVIRDLITEKLGFCPEILLPHQLHTCDGSPTGYCVYPEEDDDERGIDTEFCLICGEPIDRG